MSYLDTLERMIADRVRRDTVREVQRLLETAMNERLARTPTAIVVTDLERQLLEWAYGPAPVPGPGETKHHFWCGVPVLVEPERPLGPDEGTRADRGRG